MKDSTTKQAGGEGLPAFGPDTIEGTMRARVRETIEAIVTEELEAALGASKSARVGDTRQGYRHGHRERTLTTSLGPATIAMPRARIQAADGTTVEWRSGTVTRYQRRTVRVDEAILSRATALAGDLALLGAVHRRKSTILFAHASSLNWNADEQEGGQKCNRRFLECFCIHPVIDGVDARHDGKKIPLNSTGLRRYSAPM